MVLKIKLPVTLKHLFPRRESTVKMYVYSWISVFLSVYELYECFHFPCFTYISISPIGVWSFVLLFHCCNKIPNTYNLNERFVLSQFVEVLVHSHLVPRQGNMTEEKQFMACMEEKQFMACMQEALSLYILNKLQAFWLVLLHPRWDFCLQ